MHLEVHKLAPYLAAPQAEHFVKQSGVVSVLSAFLASDKRNFLVTPLSIWSHGNTSSKSKVTTAMIFDYDAIIEKYGIDIDIVTDQTDESGSEAKAPEYTPPPPPDPSLYEDDD